MKLTAALIIVLFIVAPIMFAQTKAEQQVTTTNRGTEVTTTFTPGAIENFPWEKLAAFLICVGASQALIIKLIIKPAVRSENDDQMKSMVLKFPSLDSFNAHVEADKLVAKRLDDWISNQQELQEFNLRHGARRKGDPQ